MTTFPGSASVSIGEYSLEVATHAGSFAQFEPEREDENAEELRAALADESEQPPAAVAAIEEFEESADAVTGRIEQAESYLRAAADGELLRLDHLTGEIDDLLDLFARLDKAGRFEEELKLIRSLNGLLALTLRWLDLIRSLRSLLRSAQAAGDKAGQAFAHHELGSLHLCTGQVEKASEHLKDALRLQDEIGDLTGRCATRHNLDSARRDAALARTGGPRRRRLLRSAVVAVMFVLLGGGSGTALALAIRGGGGAGGSGTGGDRATLIVRKDFAPDAPAASITVSVSCTNGGKPDGSPKTATESTPAIFTIRGFGKRATCTAREGAVPTGYRMFERSCRDVSIRAGVFRSCTITNRRKGVTSASLTVRKDFAPKAAAASVTVSVKCTKGGRPDTASKTVKETVAVFRITHFRKSATCTAVEKDVPSGYTSNAADCRNVAIARGGSPSCTIVNTRRSVTSATLTVKKDFSDANSASVRVRVSCDSGTVTSARTSASEAEPAVFTVTGFAGGTTCRAREAKVPSGYTADETDCRSVALANRGTPSCTIVDTLNTTTLTVHVDFSDGSTEEVSVSLVCNSGTVKDTPLVASSSSPAEFTITGFAMGATCSTTEDKLPRGYRKDESDCQDVPLASRGECTIVNSPIVVQ